MTLYRNFLKRLIDFCLSLTAIVFLLPIFLLLMIAVKLSSKGPVFFLQKRLGYHGRIFRIVKFRTMVVGAEHIGNGLRVSSTDDPRITTLGRFLRATSLDELPQLLNVIAGDMSLVGPRPPATYVPYDGYDNYPEWAKKRFEVKPGITGLAQVMVRNSVSWDERIRIDLEYLNKVSFWNDMKIVFMTVARVLKREDVYGQNGTNASGFNTKQ